MTHAQFIAKYGQEQIVAALQPIAPEQMQDLRNLGLQVWLTRYISEDDLEAWDAQQEGSTLQPFNLD